MSNEYEYGIGFPNLLADEDFVRYWWTVPFAVY